jgi:HD-GYP domain-containing protein (c-di-GMP phosphodiesterase class II)
MKLIEKLVAIDPDFEQHHQRCYDLAISFGKHLKRSQKEINMLGRTALNHDIGKITFSHSKIDQMDSISRTKQQVKLHVESGYRILNALPDFADIAKYVLHHHENWDGSGYPSGLKGEEIPFQSRIIRIIEMYDSYLNRPSEESPETPLDTLKILEQETGKRLDPILTPEFIEMIHLQLNQKV